MSQTAKFDPADPDSVYRYAADRLQAGKHPDRVADELEDGGLSGDDADAVVDQLQRAIDDAQRGQGKRNMLFGGLWLFGGLAVTIGTMMGNAGGKIFFAWGAIVFGGLQFFRGVYQVLTAK